MFEVPVEQRAGLSVSGEYFLIACDEATGRPRVNPRTVAVGLVRRCWRSWCSTGW